MNDIVASSSGYSGEPRILELRHEIIKLRHEIAELERVLGMVEWTVYYNSSGGYYYQECQWCSGQKAEGGHKPNCPRQKVLESVVK